MGVVLMDQSVAQRRLSAVDRAPAFFVTHKGSDYGKYDSINLTNYNYTTSCFSTPLVNARRRSSMLRNRLPGPYEDRVGPIVLTVLLVLSILVNMSLKLADIFSSSSGKPPQPPLQPPPHNPNPIPAPPPVSSHPRGSVVPPAAPVRGHGGGSSSSSSSGSRKHKAPVPIND